MDESAESPSTPYQNINIQEALSTRLKELRQQFPERFPKPIYVLPAVDITVDGLWEHRLRQVKRNRTGERVTLIPYHLGNSHWIGISIKSKADEQIERVEFIDPVAQSHFVPDELQKRFTKVYPGVTLQSRSFQHGNREQSAALTVENLLKAAEEAQLTDMNQTFDDCNRSSCLIAEERNLSISAVPEGNNSKLKLESNEMLKKQLEDRFAELDINSKEELRSMIIEKQQEIQSLKNKGKKYFVLKRQNTLSELEQLQLLVDRIETIEPSHSNSEYTNPDIVQTDISMEEEYAMTEENLRNMHKDFLSMSPCAERFIISLLYFLSLKLIGNTIVLYHRIEVPDRIETEIEKEFEFLKQRLKLEELSSSEIQNLVEEVFINIKGENWKSALISLRKMSKKISPLNMQELFRLIGKVDNTAQLIKNKDIIFFLGGTGSGKSTAIHFLAGSKMVEKEVRGLNHIAPVEIRNSSLKNITTSPFSRSETRYITPVTVHFNDVGGYNTGSIILCDSPGFEDTSGAEVDIANGIGIIKAIKGCKSVKPVVLISYRSIGDRCEGLKKLTHVLAGMISDVEDQSRAFSYIFTKYPPNERSAIHASLNNVRELMNADDKSDPSVTFFLNDMARKTKDGARVLDPIRDNPGEILDELAGSTAIDRPEEVFQFSITEKSKAAVHEQVRKHQLSIISATKRSEYLFIKYKLDQLKYLYDQLEQEYIVEVYNDCVRHISKHLSEEYQQGISTLNRCLMNQTVLSNEDIKQFQISIDHAQLAEELRNKHLGKEVVHSSAFIQYLNQQLDIILESLREKDIDDESVKISLDKIKLLSNSFPDMACKYKDACQFLAKKFDSVVSSFESLVMSNEFDNSATEITKLYKALTLLQDHANSKNTEVKYADLKEYFLKYLNDCVETFNQIFIQEKLEERDIDSLNSCVCMLENASNTFTLQPHIAKEAISEIYENFLSKILNHFEAIIKEVETQRKNEYSCHSVEPLIKQMTLIRTISSIESRTNQSYYSTLEKLCECMHETRRDVEEILKAFFREGGKIDYNKLTKCLSSLKKVRWIEGYRPEVYSNVIDEVTKQITQHVEELQKSVIEIKLDLDNYDKIEHVYKIVCEINKMKQVKFIVTDIDQRIDVVNLWFEREIDNICVIIKNTLSLEIWKEQGHQTLDLSKIEKGFHYLDACKKIRVLVKSDCMFVLNSLEEFVRYFSDFVQKETESCFETIKHYENENKKDMLEKVRILTNRLQEISEVQKKHSHVFSCFSNQKIIEQWQNELSSYLVELSDDMEKLIFTHQYKVLNTKLSVAQALSKLDGFLKGEKYINVYNKYQDKCYAQIQDVDRQVTDAIKNFEYEGVAYKMMTLQSSGEVGEHFFKPAKRALSVGLGNLMEETRKQAIMLGNNIEIEEVKSIVENLKRMQRAKQFVSQFLDISDEIDECIAEVKTLIGDRIKRFLEGVQALIYIHDFYETDKKLESITLVRTLLGNYCTEDVFNQIEVLKEGQEGAVLRDVVKKYSEMDITTYILNPPTDIFEKLRQMCDTNPMYNQALNTIKERIMAKCREELDKAKLKRPPDPKNIHIQKFESAVKYLPEAMRSALEVELRHCKEDIHLLIPDNDNKLKSAIGKIVMRINQSFERYDIGEVLANMKELYDYKIEFEDVFSEIRKPYFEARSRVIKTFQEAYLCFMNRFLNANEIDEAVEKSFVCLIEFMKFTDQFKDRRILTDILPEDFNEKINTLFGKILDYSTEHQKKYVAALEKLDIASLIDILEAMYKWNSLFMKIKSYEDMHSKNDTLVYTFVKILTELMSLSHILESISQKIEELRGELINLELINSDTKEFSKNRDEFYQKVRKTFSILRKAKALTKFNIRVDLNTIEQECRNSLEGKVNKIFFAVENFLRKFSEDCKLTEQDYENFNSHYRNLISFKKEIKVTHCEITDKIENIEKILFDKIQMWESAAGSNSTIQNIAMNLINMKRVSNNIPLFKIRINERIDKVLNHYRSTTSGTMDFGKLGTILNQDSIGQSIVSEHRSFQGYSLSLFNLKTQRYGIDYVLDNLTGDLVDKNQLRRRYDEFHTIYESLIKQHLKHTIELDKLISDTKLVARNIIQESDHIQWDAHIRNKVPDLAARIFALWTLQNADHYFEDEGVENKKSYLLQPHAAQVISIFRMLGIGDTNEELRNNLVQIGTGEGKSVTLGVAASILALLGFDVCCACYSEYLSQRDYTSFLSLFDSLSLLNYIRYGTFNKLCEDIINENGDIRQTVEQLISKGLNNAMQNSQQIKRAKILLIDEVDIFFSRNFYGNVYTPCASLRDPTITSLVNFIWTQRKSKLNLNKVKITDEYKACCDRFPTWELLIQEAIKDMLSDVKDFESHDYVVSQDKIGYIEQDNIVFNVVYGYKTLFAYHYEHEKGNITKESLDENISIRIKCGSFSYAEIPLEFQYIMGVTGTLKTLSDFEQQVIKNVYKIIKNTYTPSVFGKNNLRFTEKDDIMIENSNDYFNVLRREIDDRLNGKSGEKRAVLVFFESKQKLKDFYDSKALETIKESVVYLTEEASLAEKESLIRRATTSGQITLFTRTFGRGTDLICHDQSVAANGGTHVIQTFLSEEVSEEVQIKGRTARQGDYGSYSMILLDRDLEKFQIEKDHIANLKKGKRTIILLGSTINSAKVCYTVYDLLNKKRIGLFKTQYEANMKYVEQAKERHQIAQHFLSRLNFGDTESVRQFLVKENKVVQAICSSRTVCLMDATGSMIHLLHKCKTTVETMFERVSEILQDRNISSDSCQIQFVVYRNYNSREDKILQSSPWETRPDNLRAFMNTIEVEGEMGNEAIEIGLWHANKEHERENITQVILIGDAPPNTKDDVNKKRGHFGENYWKRTKFEQSTYYEDELAKLISNSIPVHAFFVERRAEESFRTIANPTGGRCEMLDINSSSGSEMLTDLVTEDVIRNIRGSSKGNALVNAYRYKFGRSYT